MPFSQSAADMSIDQQHVAILACCDELTAALGVTGQFSQVGSIRLRLAGLLQANLNREELELMAPMRHLPGKDRPRSFVELGVEAADLRRRYSEHVRQWNGAAIESDRIGYARAAEQLIRGVREHLRAKRLHLPEWRRVLPRIS